MVAFKVYRSKIADTNKILELKSTSYTSIRDEILEKIEEDSREQSKFVNPYIQTKSIKSKIDDTAEIIEICIAEITEDTDIKKVERLFERGLASVSNYESKDICKYTFYIEKEHHKTIKTKKGYQKW